MGLFAEQVKERRMISIKVHEMKMTENLRINKALRKIESRLRELEKILREDIKHGSISALVSWLGCRRSASFRLTAVECAVIRC